MRTGDALLHACLDNPDDDVPRLVYADWLEENGDSGRAQFIRLQLLIAQHYRTGDVPPGVEARESELRLAHEAKWNPLPPSLRDTGSFDRGFINHVLVSTDEEAAAAARCPEVLQVAVGEGDFTDAGLAHLASLPYLVELSLGRAALTGDGMRALAQHPRLRRIEVTSYATITGSWLRYFRDAPRLVRIRTYSTRRDEAAPEEWAEWEESRAKRFKRMPVEDRGRAARAFLFDEEYSGWKGEGSLRLIQTHVTDADLELIAVLTGLKNLDLYETDVTSRGLRRLSECAELRILSLGNNDIDDLDGLAGMAQLRELGLIGMHVYRTGGGDEYPLTDTGTGVLATLTDLESLDLRFNPITDVTLERLAGLTKLRKLELDNTSITDHGLVHLRSLKNLEYLGLEDTPVTSKGAKELLGRLPKLRIEGKTNKAGRRRRPKK